MGRYILITIALAMVLVCCDKGTSREAYSEASKRFDFEGSSWESTTVSHFVGDITYRAVDVPIAYYMLSQGVDQDSIVNQLNSLSKERVIEVEFEHLSAPDLLSGEFTALSQDQAIQYFSSAIQKDFTLVTSKLDTLQATGVLFERHFKVSPFKRLLVYFTGVPEDQAIQLIYQDQLFGNGTFKFKFNEVPLKL